MTGVHTQRSESGIMTHRPYWTDLDKIRPINAKFKPLIKGLDRDGKPNVIGGTVSYTDYEGRELHALHHVEVDGVLEIPYRNDSFNYDKIIPERLTTYLYSQREGKHVRYVTMLSY